MMPTPRVLLGWDEYTPDTGDDFAWYNLHYIHPETSDLVRFRTIDDVEITSYLDYEAFPGAVEYQLSVTINRAGAIIESPRVPASTTLIFEDLWLHPVGFPEDGIKLIGTARITTRQGQERRIAGGRANSTLFTSQLFERIISVQLAPESLATTTDAQRLSAFLLRHHTEMTVLCLRLGERGAARWFVTLDGEVPEDLEAGNSTTAIVFTEHAYRENV